MKVYHANESDSCHEDSQYRQKSISSLFRRLRAHFEYLIVDKGKLAGTGADSYSAGDATKGSDEAAKFVNGGAPPNV